MAGGGGGLAGLFPAHDAVTHHAHVGVAGAYRPAGRFMGSHALGIGAAGRLAGRVIGTGTQNNSPQVLKRKEL